MEFKSIQFGFSIPEGPKKYEQRVTYVDDLNRALQMASGHFDSAWFIDHLQFAGEDILEGFSTLAYFAGLHPQLRFGHAVLCQSFRNPALLAKMGATLQFLSGGRYIFGIGAGWHAEEYRAYGYEFPPGRVRVEQLEEALQIIRRLWTEEQVTFEGRHFRVFEARCEPRPDPVPPILVGGFRPKMLRLAARFGDEWNVSSTGIGEYRHMVRETERTCEEIGRDPETLKRSWIGGCACAPSQAEAEALAGDRFSSTSEEDFGFVGTPQQVVEQMQQFVELGVESFMLDCSGFPGLTTLEMLIADVQPAFR
jgi:alkanesulfonate monooxygenase SsuD/methylene tetrahydromethanopterin reductase-like flavin-dependent oxidoreductase (luciferase family)